MTNSNNIYSCLKNATLALMLCMGFAPVAVAGTGKLNAGSPATLDISVYFDYDEAAPDDWRPVFEAASELLYDATEKQAQLGKVEVFNRCPAKKKSADVIVSLGNKGASAHLDGIGRRGRHMFISQTHKSTSGGAIGQFGIVHELGHYLFGLYDEYLGKETFSIVPASTPVLAPAKDFFCIADNGTGLASIMDGGTTVAPSNARTEFCTDPADGFTTSHQSGFARSLDSILGVTYGDLVRNRQQLRHGESAWETMVRKIDARFGIELSSPVSQPTSDTSGHGTIDWQLEDCTPVVVFVLDRSGSMSGAPLSLAQLGSDLAINILKPGSRLGVVSFSSSATTNYPLTTIVSDAERDAAKAAINSLSATGGTNIGGGLRTALSLITSSPNRSGNEVIVLLTDGAHTGGESPESVLPDIVAENIRINGIGLGASIDSASLRSLANESGGQSDFVASVQQLPLALTRQSADTEGNLFIAQAEASLAPGDVATVPVLVDILTSELTVSVSWSTGDVSMRLIDAAGVELDPTAAGIDLFQTASSMFVRVANPLAGEWTVELQASAQNFADTDFSMLALDLSPAVQFSVDALEQAKQFPDPVKLEATLAIEGSIVGDATVTTTATAPDGASLTFELFDDGVAGHGDLQAGDGIYSNFFSRYTESGVYRFETLLDTEGASTLLPNELDPAFQSQPVPRLVRYAVSTVEVQNVPSVIPAGTLFQQAAAEDLPRIELVKDIADQRVLAFSLTAGPEEAVQVSSLKIRHTGSGDPTSIGLVKLYRDSDVDNAVDPVGDTALPLATTTFTGADGVAEFIDPIVIPAGETAHLLVSYEIGVDQVLLSGAALGTLPVAFSLCLLGGISMRDTRRRRRYVALACSLALVFALASCGGGSDDPDPPAPPPPPPPPITKTFTVTVQTDDIVANGAVTGEPIAVGGATMVTGPTITVTEP